MQYQIALYQSEDGFVLSVPGLLGCWSQAATEIEVIENIKNAIRDYLAVVDELLRSKQVRELEVSL